MTRLAGTTVLITGAASGIGRALAIQVARKQARVVLTDINEEALRQVADEIRAAGGAVLAAEVFDVASLDDTRAFAERVHAEHGSIDVLVNNAGISIWGRIEDMPHEDWRRIMEINLMGPIHLMELFVPPMIRAGRGGHIVNVSSAAGLFGLPWHAAYSASKFGLRGISEVLRFDLRKHRIRVSLVCPGGVNTGLVNTIRVIGADESSPGYQRLRARFLKHAATPELAARRIIRGIERNRYHIYTSYDIAVGHWFQRHLPWPYELIMRRLNRQFDEVALPAGSEGSGAAGSGAAATGAARTGVTP